ncbi:hypothetical protein [Clostridium baratii]|uniref:hypothetical protein n=1 Tax=Clostridium baratii TaxID=1561 RepID=UPI0006BB0F24|nr:hypothetical protein [Clostridium baratii]
MVIKNKKKKLIIITTVLIASICFASTAFFVSTDKTRNVFKVAKYEIDTKENFKQSKEWKTESIKKEVWVENNGTLPAYVRIKVVPFWKSGLPLMYDDKKTIQLEFSNSKLWKKIGDYYYYKKILKPGEKTENLIDGVKVNADLLESNKDYNIKDLSVDVFTDSIIHLDDNKNSENKQINNDRLKKTWKVQETDIL